MTVPVSANTPITRAEFTETFRSQVTDPVNAIPKWHASSNPAGGNVPSGSFSSASPVLLSSVLLNGPTITSSPVASELAGFTAVSASLAASHLQNTAIILSRARQVRLVKYYNDTVTYGNYVFFDQTAVSHLNSSYQLTTTGISNPSGTLSATGFNLFVTQLQNAVTAARNNTLTFTEQWCHTSCHANHSSRGRR